MNKEKLKLTRERMVKMLFHVWRQFDDQYYAGVAAQVAYFFLMASVPTLVVLSQLMGIFDVSLDFIRAWVTRHMDDSVVSIMNGLFDASNVGATNVLMIALALWAASSLEFSLARLTSYTISDGRYRFNFFRERFLAIPTAFFAIVAIAFSLVIFVYGETFLYKVAGNKRFVGYLLDLKGLMLFGLFFVMILVNYYILPRIKVPIRAVIPGAVMATFGITIATVIYSMYIGRASNYDLLYGSFASIIAMMLWFYIISWIICIGMMFNKAWDDVMERDRLTPAKIREYLLQQSNENSHILLNKYIDSEGRARDNYETIAVRASCRFIKGYKKELEERKRKDARKLL